MRGTRYIPHGQLPPEAFEIPGIRVTKRSGAVFVPWHAYQTVCDLGYTGGFKMIPPTRPLETALAYAEDPVRAHPLLSAKTKMLATALQREDLAKVLKTSGGILDWPTGCLAGSSEIVVNRAGKGFRLSIAEVVYRFNGGVSRGKFWRPDIPTTVQGLGADGYGRSHTLIGAYASGIKQVFRVTAGGHTLDGSVDHRFWTREGWVTLGELRVGQEVARLVRPVKGARECKAKPQYAMVDRMWHHPYANRCTHFSRGSRPTNPNRKDQTIEIARVPAHRVVVEAHLSGVDYETFIARCREGRTAGLTFLDPKVHHRDENPKNNEVSNLEVLSALAREEFFPITAIEPCGPVETYDLEVAEEPHNFTANGFVVHNSGKTLIGLAFAAAFREPLQRAKQKVRTDRPRALVVVPSTTTAQWRAEAQQWLTPDVRVGIMLQGRPSVKRRDAVVWTVDEPALARLRARGAPETLRLRSVWEGAELTPAERKLLAQAKVPRAAEVRWTLVDDLGTSTGATYPTREEAEEAVLSWSPDTNYEVLVVGWGLLAQDCVRDALIGWDPTVLVIDEAHRAGKTGSFWRREERANADPVYLKKTGAASNLHTIAANVGACLLMTATPQGDLPKNWHGLLDLYDPYSFGSYYTFGVRYAKGHKGEYGMVYDGLSNPEELRARIKLFWVHRTKAETHAGLPPVRREFIALDLRDAGRGLNMKALTAELRDAETGGSPTAMQIAVATEQKIPWATTWLAPELAAGSKVFIWVAMRANGRTALAALRARYPDVPLFHGDGTSSSDERRAMVASFIGTEGAAVMIGTLGAFGEAIDGLQHVDVALVLTVPWTPQMLIQGPEGRHSRKGGTRSVRLIYVRMNGTVDDVIWSRVGAKLGMVADVRDDEDARALGSDMRGDSPEQQEASLEALAALLVDWQDARPELHLEEGDDA